MVGHGHRPRRRVRGPVPCDPVDHPAVRAWQRLAPRARVSRVEAIRERRRSAVYRLSPGDAGPSVIAKRGSREQLSVERTVYERVLPCLTMPVLGYYGFAQEDDEGFAWMFLEDAGDVRCAPAQHEALVGRWLGTLHSGAAALDVASCLPDRGPGYSLENLRTAHATIHAHFDHPALCAGDREMLRGIVASCERIEARWSGVEALCDGMPRTLVHGDLASKNLRLTHRAGGTTIVAFDWEWSGWGVPAADTHVLGQGATDEALLAYRAALSEYAPALDDEQTRLLSFLGTGFRLLAWLGWSSLFLPHDRPEYGVAELHLLESPLREWAVGLTAAPGPSGPLRP